MTSFGYIEATGPIPPPTPEDIEDHADRLRFMGVDEERVLEFERRAAVDYWSARQWMQRYLASLPQPPKYQCDCGEALVADDWQGKATVRCSECGRRWGLDVQQGRGSQWWSVSGPVDEWLVAHPPDPTGPYGDHEPEDVIANGLPPAVGTIEPGTGFPLATYVSGRWAVVLYAFRNRLTEFDLPGDEYGYEFEYLRLDPDEGWINFGSSGSGWVNPFEPPHALLEKYVVLGTGYANPCSDDECISMTGGLCSSAVAAVVIEEEGTTSTIVVDPARPYFLACTTAAEAVVRFLDHHGTPLHDHRGAMLEFYLGADDGLGDGVVFRSG